MKVPRTDQRSDCSGTADGSPPKIANIDLITFWLATRTEGLNNESGQHVPCFSQEYGFLLHVRP